MASYQNTRQLSDAGSPSRRDASTHSNRRHSRPQLSRASITEASITTSSGIRGSLVSPKPSHNIADLLSRVVISLSPSRSEMLAFNPLEPQGHFSNSFAFLQHDQEAMEEGREASLSESSTSTDGGSYFSFPCFDDWSISTESTEND